MIRDSMYENRGRQEDRRKKREEEKQKRALKNALAAGRSAYDPGDALLMGEDEIVANAREWNRKADSAAEKAEKFAQSAIRAEAAGDMGTAAFLWGDSQKSDQNAQKCRREAMRYENMLQPPDTVPKPMSVRPAKGMKSAAPPSASPGAVTQGELAAGQEKAVWSVPDKGRQESAPSVAEMPAGTYADREELELRIKNLRSEMQAYYDTSDGEADPHVMVWYANQIHDAMTAKDALDASQNAISNRKTKEKKETKLGDVGITMEDGMVSRSSSTAKAKKMDETEDSQEPIDWLKQLLLAVGTDVAGDYVQTAATAVNFLGQFTSSKGYQEQAEITLSQLQAERDVYVQGGIPEDNIL